MVSVGVGRANRSHNGGYPAGPATTGKRGGHPIATSEHTLTSHQIEYVPVPPDPLELDPLPLPEPLPEDVENDDPLDLLPEPLLEPLEEPDVDPDPEPDAEPEPETEAEPLPLVCAVASATPLVAISAGRSLCVHTPSAE